MEQTFEQMKDAAKEVHRRFYKYCTSSFNDIVNTDNVRDLRRVVIRYRDYVSDPRAARYIRENYADVLEALGLRIQFYIDGRVRLYLQRAGNLGCRELRPVHQARRMRAMRCDHRGIPRRRADPLVGRQANRLPIRPALFDRHTRQDLPRAPDRGATRFPILTLKKR